MARAGRREKLGSWLITEKGRCRIVEKLYSSPSNYFRWNNVAVIKGI
jgi:hypothetical protein